MSSFDSGLLSSLQQQTSEERRLPASILEDTENEKAQYEKDLLQGAGGLLLGGTAERTFSALKKSGKGAAALKRLGMSDEDINTFTQAIKDRDSGAITDLLVRKGTGYVEGIGNKLVGKGIKAAKSTADSIQDGTVFQDIQDQATKAITNTTSTLRETLGDVPGRASELFDDIPSVFGGGGGGFGGGFGTPGRAFTAARAQLEGEANLEEQTSAVRAMLSKSKAGRKLIEKNAKKRAAGEPVEDAGPAQPRTEFDLPDEQGDYIQSIRDAAQKDFVQNKLNSLPKAPKASELNPFTGEELSPLDDAKAAVQKVNDDFDKAVDNARAFGDRDPYQDIYDQADRAAERFTEAGKTQVKPSDISFEQPRITRSEHMKQMAQEQKEFEDSLPDLGDLVTGSGPGGAKPVADAIQQEVPREAPVPPSQQTGGLDPSQLPDDASYQRGGSKIKAKRPVDEPTPSEPIQAPEKAFQEELPPVKAEPIPAGEPAPSFPTFDEHPVFDILKKQNQQPLPAQPKAPAPSQQQEEVNKTLEPSSHDPQPEQDIKPAAQNDPALGSGEKTLGEEIGGAAERDTAEKVGGDLTKAFTSSLAEDAVDPAGIILSGLLGVGALIGGFLRKSHHPHFVQPPSLHPTENFSVQQGVA